MRLPVPNSGGRPPATLREFNACHAPGGSSAGGQFCAKGSQSETMVGVTSSRPGKEPRQVFGQMRDFEGALGRLPGVTNVSVKPGVGQWDGGWEPSWVVRYTGNGAARKLMAQIGQQYDQDAVLLMKPCRGADCDSLADVVFARPINRPEMMALAPVLAASGLGGWTWAKAGGKTVLRTAAVPAWGTDRTAHLAAVKRLRAALAERGHLSRQTLRSIKTEVISRDDYRAVLGG